MPACDAQEVIIREKLQKLEARLTEREDTAERIREQIKLATGQLGGVRVATSVTCNAFFFWGGGGIARVCGFYCTFRVVSIVCVCVFLRVCMLWRTSLLARPLSV